MASTTELNTMDSPLLRTFQDCSNVKVPEIERNEVFSLEDVNLALKKMLITKWKVCSEINAIFASYDVE